MTPDPGTSVSKAKVTEELLKLTADKSKFVKNNLIIKTKAMVFENKLQG